MIDLAHAIAAFVAALGFYWPPHTTVDAAVWLASQPDMEHRLEHWNRLAFCETRGRNIVNSTGTYRGYLQFSVRSWVAVGGTGDPIDWSWHEQLYRAERLYARQGANAWPGCTHQHAPLAGLTRLDFNS